MTEIPSCYNPDCAGYVSVNEQAHEYAGHDRRQIPDCASCVYFSSRNCGRDSGSEFDLFDQPLI